MLSVYQTLSLRYLGRRWVRAVLIVASIALGVATLVATRALNDTMNRAGLAKANPMPGVADLVISNGELPVAVNLAATLAEVPGVQEAWPRIFENVRLPDLDQRTVLVMGIDKNEGRRNQSLDITLTPDEDLQKILADIKTVLDTNLNAFLNDATRQYLDGQFKQFLAEDTRKTLNDYLDKLKTGDTTDQMVIDLVSRLFPPVMVGDELNKALEQTGKQGPGLARALSFLPDEIRQVVLSSLPKEFSRVAEKLLAHLLIVQRNPQSQPVYLLRVGTVKGKDAAAVLGGNILILDLADAGRVLGMAPGQANRIDLTFQPGLQKTKVREAVEKLARGHGMVRTPEEQTQAMGNVMSGMQTGFSLCGLAALVVGLFLVYNALAVCVAERRHEIGVLLSLGATQQQVRLLFAGEAAVLGLAGSLLGVPLGIGLAYLGLQPMQEILSDIFMNVEANQVEVSWGLVTLAMAAGMVTATAAALVPAMSAARENPAAAVRQIAKAPTLHRLAWQVVSSLLLIGLGTLCILVRHQLPSRMGTYGGMMSVLLGALVAAPLLTAIIARMLQPLAQQLFPITWRLAADNLVRAPGRTGLVIAALAAGVALVTQTFGTIVSNRTALRGWVQEAIAADLIVTSGSPVGAGGGQTVSMNESLGKKLRAIPGVEAALPMRSRRLPYGEGERATQILLFATDAAESYRVESKRLTDLHYLELYKALGQNPHRAIISENFAALHGVGKGDTITLSAGGKEARFLVIGKVVDYSWNHGTIFIDRAEYKELWNDNEVELYDIYVEPGADVARVQETLRVKLGAENALVVQTRQELQHRIDDMIERLYGIALSQQFVVMFVAALGVVTALLISVLQRRREMGLLRAIGAARGQVVRSVLAEACLMGIIGTIIGFLVGVPLEWYVLKVLILEESGYLFAVYIPWREGLVIVAAGLITPILAGLGPAIHSVRQRIPEAIAYE
jgi:putative ABC transport system permease protein